RQSRSVHDDVLLTAYFRDRIHSARVLASASETAFGGMGIGPQTPLLPFLMWVARVSAAPAVPAFLAASSLRAGPTIFMSTLWHAAQGLLLNSASPSAARAGCRLMAAPRASIRSRTFFICGVPYKAKEAGSDPASRGAPQYTSCWVLCTLNLPVGVINLLSRITVLSLRVLSSTTTMADSSSCPLHTENQTSSPARLYSGCTTRLAPSLIPDQSPIGRTV